MLPMIDKIYRNEDGYCIVLEIAVDDSNQKFVIYKRLSDEFNDEACALPLEKWKEKGFVEIDPQKEFENK